MPANQFEDKDNQQNDEDLSHENINVYQKSKGVIINEETVGDVNAEIVKMANSSAKNISAKNSAKVEKSLIKNVITQNFDATQMAAYKVSSEKAKYSDTVVCINDSNETILDNTLNVVSVSNATHATKMNSFVNYSRDTTAEEIKSVIFIGKKINGNIKTILTTKTAAIFGGLAGLVFFFLKILFKNK
ncbi:MAG: hypothetical protein DKM50_01530 [Candidatus Margulisiibacteriota bacterium]|nr:MAG: hypothetical protein A2X43_08280 [Candidatus Margulisbacteria bacterium GWD2_39_127]OGI03127.1 MAG: hypothetical protein A2X42_10890 [Candidatus Margulisbacteria bacterium GWF2_38_17]OGI11670.1 MAG: hypothetical protein A2X41_10300 [Candidatus Margulisbacteria bacterium GWE2_39_32]PZM83784.1 MAG: hypothetical protein DKM50_01530 [Candidatus Margulisiibacteriota bacterium]HAR63024.1 hypothetical protein [Candidatus Margulisiibacteriota bacterium]